MTGDPAPGPGAGPSPLDVAPDDLDRPFWDATRDHRLLVHRCDRCGRCYWPATCCTEHGGDEMAWVPASGRGTLHTWTVYHHAYAPRMAGRVPYVVAVVKLDEGPFMHTGIAGCEPDALAVGLPVEVVFEDQPDGTALPYFRPRA